MIEDPVQKESEMVTKLLFGFIQKIISSQNRDKWSINIDAKELNSIAKSRSETASIEFRHMFLKPNFFATLSLLIGKLVPASAAEPSGI